MKALQNRGIAADMLVRPVWQQCAGDTNLHHSQLPRTADQAMSTNQTDGHIWTGNVDQSDWWTHLIMLQWRLEYPLVIDSMEILQPRKYKTHWHE